ncbi:4954_t:CDS:2 [Gigaspora margarita]|uniref:4954_t:CDS:1 n=1 Tax=Gigaspora margarita TaxID=4874 RepID=A0ABN7UPX4_GIGMA|nr:4954_t:CDS:2 [Gigaspora margarita]
MSMKETLIYTYYLDELLDEAHSKLKDYILPRVFQITTENQLSTGDLLSLLETKYRSVIFKNCSHDLFYVCLTVASTKIQSAKETNKTNSSNSSLR